MVQARPRTLEMEGKLSLGRKKRDEIFSQMGREGFVNQVLPGDCVMNPGFDHKEVTRA